MKRAFGPLTLVLLLAAGTEFSTLSGCKGSSVPVSAAKKWHCAMHPQIVKDRPGDCPICGMKLVPLEPSRATGSAATSGQRRILFYRSPMNPLQTSPVPKKDAMGMDFVPVYDEGEGAPRGPEGLASVTIDPQKQQLIGLKTAIVTRGPFETTIRTVGRVTFDETRIHHLHTKYDAYVEHVPEEVNFIGAFVNKGQGLLSLYSPDLFATEQEYLLAWRARRSLQASKLPNVAKGGADLYEAARQRLLLLDLTVEDITALERKGLASRSFELHAPISGFVVGKIAVHGMKVTAADSLFDIADLSHVWVLADVYEYELPRVAVGQTGTMTLSYWPDRAWRGHVTYVFPTVDEKTRTVKVRLEFANPGAELKPEMFANVVISGKPRKVLRVPDDAVLDSGTRKIVFVALGEGHLQPREIGTGDHAGGVYEVKSGLQEGESVALGANFLVDSESRLKSALSAFAPAAGTDPGSESSPVGGAGGSTRPPRNP